MPGKTFLKYATFSEYFTHAYTVCLCLCPRTRGAFGTVADVGVFSILAGASVPARLAQTLVDVGFTQPARVTGATVAGEGRQAVHAGTVVARA